MYKQELWASSVNLEHIILVISYTDMYDSYKVYCYVWYFQGGYIWVTGRIDDMVNVSGHLLSTAEIESALIEHASVAEAAVVSHPHEVKGECTYCFVSLCQVYNIITVGLCEQQV